MRLGNETMNKNTVFSALQLRQLLIDIVEHAPQVCVRFRLLGEMWQTHMLRVINVSENRALINDEIHNKLISIDLNLVMQFEIDNKFKAFQPYFHYEVIPDHDLRSATNLRF
jgi:hypothetical protein